MKIIHKYDENGKWIPSESTIIHPDSEGNYEIPADYTDKELPQPNYKPKFDIVKNEWIETITQEELDIMKNTPQPLSEIEQLKKQQADLIFELMMNGVI
jgi:hypothetical protein